MNEYEVNKNLGDKEIMDDVLSSQKHITGTYNTFSNECVNVKLKSDFLNILREEHNLQSSVFAQMQQNGWYSPAPAQTQQINQTRSKFQNISPQL